MVTYYRDDALHITADAIQVDGRRYRLDQLQLVWHRRTARWRRAGYMVLSRGGLIGLVLLVLLGAGVAACRADLRRSDVTVLAGVGLAVVVLGAAAAFAVDPVLDLIDRTYEHGRGVHEIWARVEGRDVQLYQTTDVLRFGKAYRSLQRAVEQSR